MKTLEKGWFQPKAMAWLFYVLMLAVWPLNILFLAGGIGYAIGKGGGRGVIHFFASALGTAIGYLVALAKPRKKQAPILPH